MVKRLIYCAAGLSGILFSATASAHPGILAHAASTSEATHIIYHLLMALPITTIAVLAFVAITHRQKNAALNASRD